VFPKYDGAQGLGNWTGRCQGAPCSFYLSDSNSSNCNDGFEPNGDNNTSYSIYRWGSADEACWFGRWNDGNNGVSYQGSVICSPNDVGPKVLSSCQAYEDADSLHSASDGGINGKYLIDADGDGPELAAEQDCYFID
jgi:hypothetical protein